MPNVSRKLAVAASAALLALAANLPAYAAHRVVPRGTGLYDGLWSVVIQTKRGNCTPAVRAGVRIVGGRVSAEQAGDEGYRVDGRVAPSGAVRVSVAGAGQGAAGSGRLSRNDGSGRWQTWSGECAGQWTAARR